MSDDFAAITRDLEASIAAATAALDRLRALPALAIAARSDAELSDVEPNDWVGPGRIVNEFKISRGHLHRLCGLHPIGGPTGFAFWSSNRFLISLSRFERFARIHPVRRRVTKNT